MANQGWCKNRQLMFPTNFKWQESIFEEYTSQGSSGIYDDLWHSVCLGLFPSSSIPSDKTPELCCPSFNNAIYASAAINSYYSYTLVPQSPLPPPPHRCYMMIVREEPPLPPPTPTQPPRKKKRCCCCARSRAVGYTCQSLSGGDIMRPAAELITLQIY